MAQPITEMLANFTYSPKLTYNDLLVAESNLKDELADFFETHGATGTVYDTVGDSLRVQCSFDDYSENFFHKFCDHLLGLLHDNIEAKILFVHKDVSEVNLYTLFNGDWQESSFDVPHNSEFAEILMKEKKLY